MSRIRYLAILCSEPAALAGFYGRCFGMEEIGRADAGDVTLTDGGFNLTLLPLSFWKLSAISAVPSTNVSRSVTK